MFREYVNKKPAIMVITSHHKEDIEILCDQVYSIKMVICESLDFFRIIYNS